MKKQLKKKKHKPNIFYLDIPPTRTDLVLIIGLRKNDVLKAIKLWVRQNRLTKSFYKMLEESSAFKWIDERRCGFFIYDSRKAFIWMDNWDLSTLVHETNHVVESMADEGNYEDEKEFKAYTQTWIYDELVNYYKRH